MPFKRPTERAKFFYADEYNHLELLHATFVTHRFVPHFHETYVVGVLEQGDYAFLCRGTMQFARTGGIVLVNPGEIHTGEAVDDVGWTYRTLYPGAALMQQIAEEITGAKWTAPYFPQPVIYDQAVSRGLLRLHQALETSSTQLERDTLLRLALGELISRHAQNRPAEPAGLNGRSTISRVQDYLHAHYDHNVGLADLAALAGLSPYHLVRVFREHTGLPPHHYLVQVRLMQAKRLLRQQQTIAEVAQSTGFSDQSHLTRWFKKVVGVSPGQYLAQR
jgi:AraC-like DNA-binding protein